MGLKIVVIGGGSSYTPELMNGFIRRSEELLIDEIWLVDIPEGKEHLSVIRDLSRRMWEAAGLRTKIYTTLDRKEALPDADFVITQFRVGRLYARIKDERIPLLHGMLGQETNGAGGIFKALRTIPVMEDFARDMEEVCPNTLFLNYTNPMAILSGYMQRYTKVRTVGLCHSVQVCTETILKGLGMEDKLEGATDFIAGINHMAWLLDVRDKDGNDLYPEIRRRALEKNASEKHGDMIRYEYIRNLGYYCTESSEHNSEYNPFYIKSRYPELIDRYNIPLDEYPRRCVKQIADWEEEKRNILNDGKVTHERSREYASYIMEAVVTNRPYQIGGNVLNTGLIDNLPSDACVEVPCLVNAHGVNPCHVGRLPVQLAAMNQTNINVQLLTIEAARTRDRNYIYQAAMLDPHTAAELSVDDIRSMCDELIEAHGEYMAMYR